MKRFIAFLCLAVVAGMTTAQELIPTPVEVSYKGKKKVKIESIDAKVDASLNLPEEGYTLEIKGTTAVLRAKTAQGLVWANATLTQLKDDDGLVRIAKIKDYPAFPIRGFMHDTGRNFRSVENLKKDIDLFSAYKLNVFHWHLTDNPAWRIESRCYPQLNDPKYCPAERNPGKFYTYDEIREVIKYAKERGVMIIPELDIPGHSQYFWTIFGVYMESEKGMKILDKLFAEFFAEIPAEDCPYIHLGSDEVRRKMKDAEGFVRKYEQLLAKHNRIPIVWDPGIKPSSTTVCQIWNEAIKNSIAENKDYKNPYLDSYMGYLNHSNPVNNMHRHFLHQMCTTDKGSERALGAILCLWNDVRLASEEQLFPINGMPIVMLPYAERAWVGGKGYDLTYDMLIPGPENKGHHDLVAFEKKIAYHRDHNLRDWDVRWVANAHIPWQVTIPAPQGTKMDAMQWTKAYGGSVNLYALGKQHGVKQQEKMIAYLKTEIYSEEDREIRAWVSLETPSRSTRRSAGIGEQGEWETGGKVTINGEAIVPPVAWNEPGMYSYHFSTYKYPDIQNLAWTNEQLFWMREPAKIKLKKGWNTLLIEAPLHYKTPFWYASFSPVEVGADGRWTEVKGLQYR